MKIILILIACPLFLISAAGHLYVKLRMRPGDDLDDYYHEFEEQHAGYARYTKWSQFTFTGAVIGALLLFAAVII